MKMTLVSRFWSKVSQGSTSDCWPWNGTKSIQGYGVFVIDGKSRVASRVAYMLAKGSIPIGKCVCHTCDNRLCVNPAHLFVGSKVDNNRDRDSKGRQARGRLHGFALHPERIARGERASKAKLSAKDVRAIRERYTAGGVTIRALGAQYGISHTSVRYIIVRKNWRHITE
jgi:hypothetical protein